MYFQILVLISCTFCRFPLQIAKTLFTIRNGVRPRWSQWGPSKHQTKKIIPKTKVVPGSRLVHIDIEKSPYGPGLVQTPPQSLMNYNREVITVTYIASGGINIVFSNFSISFAYGPGLVQTPPRA